MAATIGALYTAASILPGPAKWLWLFFFSCTPLGAVATFAVTSRRSGLLAFVTLLVTPIISGFVPALFVTLSFANPTKAFELGVLASIPIVLGILPACIAWRRIHRDGARRSTAVRRLWLVTATTLGITACISWNPRETLHPSEPSFAPIVWEPPHATWVDEFRLTAVIAFLILAAAMPTIVVVTKLDRDELRRFDAHWLARSRTDSHAFGPYRRVDLPEERRHASAPLRRAVRIDLVCLVLAVASVVYLVARIHHLEANMTVADSTDDETGARSVAFPSLRYACSLLSTGDRWDDVNAKLVLAHAAHETIAVGDYRWQPAPPRPRRSRGSCHVTFDVDRTFSFIESVRSVKFSDNETTD